MASQKKYQVFISFRGIDTRKSFITHLHTALQKEQIKTYIDDRLERGEEIWPALKDAIDDSQISIVVFSPKYASSSWCLNELVHILHCRDNIDQTVIPVFYNVESSDLRWEGGLYAKELVDLKKWFDHGTINKWRAALERVSYFAGRVASNTKNDIELIEEIVKDVKKNLKYTVPLSDHLKGLVGIENHIKEVKSLLFTSSSEARIIGICGMVGFGKTTLAKAVFTQLHPQFEGHCFLANIREERERYGVAYLQKLFFGDLSKEKDLDLANQLRSVKKRLHSKRLLIVLDDVSDVQQYEDLVKDQDWLNSESKVIITSRDQQVLRSVNISVKDTYYLKEMNKEDGLQLFCSHAFLRIPTESDKKTSEKCLIYAQGVPLALIVLGSHLRTKRKEEWEGTFNKLKKAPNRKIIDVLEISFDGLDNKQKEIFLYIECFFQGYSIDYVKNKFNDGGCCVDVIRNQVDKSLITTDNYRRFWIHELLQKMGSAIVSGEVGEHSRLCVQDHISHEFKTNTEMRIEFGVSSTKFEVKMGKGVQTSRERGRPCTPEEAWLRHHA